MFAVRRCGYHVETGQVDHAAMSGGVGHHPSTLSAFEEESRTGA
jgi:hypothetical protein